ncbi:hypothetical protein BDV93DRAFT_545302 [Ceratobasidium sp. AG-I]|nr:hypothetical protein BDV93DRAFT_545302 [Ceratobasidium sp. AG-I]
MDGTAQNDKTGLSSAIVFRKPRHVKRARTEDIGTKYAHKMEIWVHRDSPPGLTTLPCEIFLEIASFTDPIDLLSLTRSCKTLHSTPMEQSTNKIWRAAESNVPGLPNCPPDMRPQDYSALIFTKSCTLLFVGRSRILSWNLSRRLVEVLGRHNELVAADNVEVLEQWRVRRHALVEARRQFGEQLQKFLALGVSTRLEELSEIRAQRRQAIEERLRRLGWSKEDLEFDHVPTWQRWMALVYQPKRLTERVWTDLLPMFVDLLAANRAKQLERETSGMALVRSEPDLHASITAIRSKENYARNQRLRNILTNWTVECSPREREHVWERWRPSSNDKTRPKWPVKYHASTAEYTWAPACITTVYGGAARGFHHGTPFNLRAYALTRLEELSEIRAQRRQAIEERLRGLGWSKERLMFNHAPTWQRWMALVDQPRRLTDRANRAEQLEREKNAQLLARQERIHRLLKIATPKITIWRASSFS